MNTRQINPALEHVQSDGGSSKEQERVIKSKSQFLVTIEN